LGINQVEPWVLDLKNGHFPLYLNGIIVDKMMNVEKNTGELFDVLIEISTAQGPVKYEYCKVTEKLRVDRFLQTSMSYPCNYGYIPNTMSDDGDPCDVLVYCEHDLFPGSVIKARPIAMLVMEDEAGLDNKILAVPVESISPSQASTQNIADIDQRLLNRIEHFFLHYKDLESNKWVKLQGWKDKDEAIKEVEKGIDQA